jgi:hypothetical protein
MTYLLWILVATVVTALFFTTKYYLKHEHVKNKQLKQINPYRESAKVYKDHDRDNCNEDEDENSQPSPLAWQLQPGYDIGYDITKYSGAEMQWEPNNESICILCKHYRWDDEEPVTLSDAEEHDYLSTCLLKPKTTSPVTGRTIYETCSIVNSKRSCPNFVKTRSLEDIPK